MLLQKACVSNALKILPFLPILILSKLNSFKWVSSIGFFRLFTCVRGHSAMMSVVMWKKIFSSTWLEILKDVKTKKKTKKPWQWFWIGRGRTFGNIWRCLWWWSVVRGIGDASGIYWVEARGSAKHPTMHRTAAHGKGLAKMSIVRRLRNPVLARSTYLVVLPYLCPMTFPLQSVPLSHHLPVNV